MKNDKSVLKIVTSVLGLSRVRDQSLGRGIILDMLLVSSLVLVLNLLTGLGLVLGLVIGLVIGLVLGLGPNIYR